MNHRTFPLDLVLTLTTEHLLVLPTLGDNGMDRLRDLISHITGDKGLTDMAVTAYQETCTEFLHEQFPALKQVDIAVFEQLPGDFACRHKEFMRICSEEWDLPESFDVPQTKRRRNGSAQRNRWTGKGSHAYRDPAL